MTGTLTVGDTSTSATVATIKSSNASGTYIQFVNGTTPTVEVGYNATYGAYLYNDKLDSHPTLCLGLADNLRDAIIYRYAGVNYNVWHSGSLKPYQFTNWADTRSVNHVPNDYDSLFIMRGIKNLTTIGLSDSGVYATVWGWRGWQDKSGGHAWEIASTNNDLYTRHGETTSWTSWAKILNSSNYQNYPNTKVGVSTIWLYPENTNEINFGGTNTTSTIFFGYRAKDSRVKPEAFVFGNNNSPSTSSGGNCTIMGANYYANASSGPHFYGRADANNWAYIRLYSGTTYGDIAITTNSSASSTAGGIELRPSGTESKKGGVTGEGYLFTQSSGHLTRIGSVNTAFCHFYTTAQAYYFDKQIAVNGHITPSATFTYDLGATSAAWNRVYSNIFVSKIATGTQPFQCVSTTTCTNLNADLLDGFHGSEESTANTYVRRNQNKYISVNYINSDTAKNENHDFTQIITTDDGDNYYRKAGIRFFMKRLNSYTKTIDLKSLDANKYYPISFQLVQMKSFIRIKIWNCLDGNKPTWATHPNGFAAAIEWDTTVNGWGAQDTQRIIYADNYKYCDKSPCGGIEQNTKASVEIVYLRGGAIYYYNNNDNIEAIINSNGYSWTSNTYSYSAPVINNIKNRAYSCYNLSLRSFSTLYCSDIISYRLNISSTSTFGETATFNGGMYSGNIFPLSNNNYRIGSSSNRFIDAYIQTWVYANSGLYMNPSGITQNGSYLELSSGGNEIIIAGGTDFYVNYRSASYGGRSVPKKWYWRAGSSSSWANMEFGDCTLHGWINSTGITGSGAYAYNVGARFANTSHDSIEIVGGNYTMGLGCHSNGSWHWWRGTANPTSSTNKSYVMEYDGSTWAFTGSITATAAITAKATSDFRLKENYDGLIDYRERLLKLGRVYDYNYNKKALDLYQDRIDNKRHTGLVYQNAVKAGITNFCHEKDEYGYGSLNYLSPDLIATIIGSVQANILSIRLVESEQERMRKELEHAKSEINRLKGLVASLQN